MRILFGMILGAIVTVASAYAYDTMTGRIVNGAAVPGQRPMVNWDVVHENWRGLRANMREMGNRVHDEWVKRSG